jgi:hypothetical protein
MGHLWRLYRICFSHHPRFSQSKLHARSCLAPNSGLFGRNFLKNKLFKFVFSGPELHPDKSVDQAPACFPKIDPRLLKVGSRFKFRKHQPTTVGNRCRWKFPLRALLFASSPNKSLASWNLPELRKLRPSPSCANKVLASQWELLPQLKLVVRSRNGISPDLTDQLGLVNLNYFVVCIILRRNASLAWMTPQQSRISFRISGRNSTSPYTTNSFYKISL